MLSKKHRENLSEALKGNTNGFKKGNIPWNKGKKNPKILGKNNVNWKGDKVSYRCLHKWVTYLLGKPKKCEHCGKEKTTPKSIHWANKSGEYLRDKTDWISLCSSCHQKYDRRKRNECGKHNRSQK